MGLIIKNKTKYVGGPNSAKYVEYNNTESQLEASNVQEAIDLLAQGAGGGNALEMVLTQAEYDALGDEKYTDDITYYITDAAEFDADNVGYNNIESGLEARTVQDALDEMLIKINSGSGAGEDGKSAYEIWLEIEGNEGKTVEEFLASLKGPKGEKGDTPELTGYLKDTDDTQNNVVNFTSDDSTEVNEYTEVETLTSGEKHSSIFNKISTAVKNIRYLMKVIGNEDISTIGDGTVKGAISTLNSDLTLIPSVPNTFGNSFGKNLLNVNLLDAKSDINKSSYFIVNKDDIDNWSGLNDSMKTIVNDMGAWIGYREVFYRNNIHVFIKVTEMYPYNGRTWCRFYNNGDWYVDWTVSATKGEIDTIQTTEEDEICDGLKIKRRNGVVELSNSKWVSFNTDTLIIPEKYRGNSHVCVSALCTDSEAKVYPSRISIDMVTGKLTVELYKTLGGSSEIVTTGHFVGLNATWIL